MHEVLRHPNKDALIAELRSEDDGKRRMLRISEISPKIQCLHCVKYWTEGMAYCDSGTWLVPTDSTRKLNRERFDALTIPHFTIKNGGSRGVRHDKSEEQ